MKRSKKRRHLFPIAFLCLPAIMVLFLSAFGIVVQSASEPSVILAVVKNGTIRQQTMQEFTVMTTSDATRLVEYAEDGRTPIKTWTATSSNSKLSGEHRIWTVSQIIRDPGNRTLYFKAGTASALSSGTKSVRFTVEDTWVNEVSVKCAAIGKGGLQTFTVRTTAGAQYLNLYAEGRNLVKTWKASADNSTVANGIRTWTVSLAINDPGDRELTFKAGKTKAVSILGQTVKFRVDGKKILNAGVKYSAITKTTSQEFTVKTSSDVMFLRLYAEDGTTPVKTWKASESSVLGTEGYRIWDVQHVIQNSGNRKLIFKGGTTSNTPVTNSVTVSFRVKDSGVLTVVAKYPSIERGAAQTFTVTTTSDAYYLMLYAEDGTQVMTWEGTNKYCKNDWDVKIWTVSQPIYDAGERTLTFKAGATTSSADAQRAVTFKVRKDAVHVGPSIVEQPRSVSVASGKTAQFFVDAVGKKPLTYQWQELDETRNIWIATKRATANYPTIYFTTKEEDSGMLLRCAVTDTEGHTVYSRTASLTIIPDITKQPPREIKVALGETGTVGITVSGKTPLKYRWQLRRDVYMTWTDCNSEGAQTSTLTIPGDQEHHNWMYRCIVTDAYGRSAISDEVTLSVLPKITRQPADVHALPYRWFELSVEAIGEGPLTYQWDYYDPKQGHWAHFGGLGTGQMILKSLADPDHANWSYRCVVTDANGMKSKSNSVKVIID